MGTCPYIFRGNDFSTAVFMVTFKTTTFLDSSHTFRSSGKKKYHSQRVTGASICMASICGTHMHTNGC